MTRTVDRRLWGLLALLVALVLAVAASLAFGSRAMPLTQLPSSLIDAAAILRDPTNADSASDAYVIAQLRIPRTVLALLVGAALGVAGTLMQGHTRNPLADPALLGISAGAAFGVVFGFSVLSITALPGTMALAFAGALGATALVFGISSIGGGAANPMSVILGGAGLTAVLAALTSAMILADSTSLELMRFWTVGSVAGRDLGISAAVAPVIVAGVAVALGTTGQLNLLGMGADVAASLGVNTGRARALGIVLIALLAGSATAAAGPIAFIGLLVPHLIRSVTGPDYRWLMPYCALAGAVLLLAADVAGRVIARPGEVQVGITLAFVGAPFMLWLIARRKLVRL